MEPSIKADAAPVVAAGLVKVQNPPPSHHCLGVLHGEDCPLDGQCRLSDEGFSVDPLELAIADAILSVEGSQSVLGDFGLKPQNLVN